MNADRGCCSLICVYLRSSAAKLSSLREAGNQPNFHGASKLRRDVRISETLLDALEEAARSAEMSLTAAD
jgi:hypothetical protein